MVILVRFYNKVADQESNLIFATGFQKETRADRSVSSSKMGPKGINPCPSSKEGEKVGQPLPLFLKGDRGGIFADRENQQSELYKTAKARYRAERIIANFMQ
jgi:hypothetical protein